MIFNRPIMEFYCHPDWEGIIPEPRPAAKYIREWFKKIPPTLDSRDEFNAPSMSAKKCMPLIDAMSLGYVIPLAGDLHIMTNGDRSIISAHNPPGIKLAEFHSLEQIGGEKAPGAPGMPVKFINHWVIKTRKGWSTMVMPLVNDVDKPHFTCLSGLVDTDNYPKEINFPAIWNTPDFDGTLPAGTPLVVVFPIKRSAVPRNPVVRKMKQSEFKRIDDISKMQKTRSHVYTQELREPRK